MGVGLDELYAALQEGTLLDFPQVANPAAGANASYDRSYARAFRVLYATATVTTDANAANRQFSLDYLAGGRTLVRNTPAAVITASTTNLVYIWSMNLALWDGATNAPTLVPLLPLWLPPACSVQFTLDSIQVGDQLSALSLVVEELPPEQA